MVRYIVEKYVCNDYAHGHFLLMNDDGKPKVFITESEALDFLRGLGLSIDEIHELYNIKPYVI